MKKTILTAAITLGAMTGGASANKINSFGDNVTPTPSSSVCDINTDEMRAQVDNIIRAILPIEDQYDSNKEISPDIQNLRKVMYQNILEIQIIGNNCGQRKRELLDKTIEGAEWILLLHGKQRV